MKMIFAVIQPTKLDAVLPSYKDQVQNLPDYADLIVLSEHPDAQHLISDLKKRSNQHRQIIVAPAGFVDQGDKGVQGIYVFVPDQEPVLNPYGPARSGRRSIATRPKH